MGWEQCTLKFHSCVRSAICQGQARATFLSRVMVSARQTRFARECFVCVLGGTHRCVCSVYVLFHPSLDTERVRWSAGSDSPASMLSSRTERTTGHPPRTDCDLISGHENRPARQRSSPQSLLVLAERECGLRPAVSSVGPDRPPLRHIRWAQSRTQFTTCPEAMWSEAGEAGCAGLPSSAGREMHALA